jgi:ligand-binding SRPBCC domain-containing protein
MPTLEFETTIAAPLERVWAWHQDVHGALAALTPPGEDLRIESAEPLPPVVGTKVVVTARGPLGRRVRWVAAYAEVRPPHAVVWGEEARFVDVQESGPFKSWRHEHEFEHAGEDQTRLVDRLTYQVGWGPIGWIADWVYVRPKLRRMFAHRHGVTRRALESELNRRGTESTEKKT